MHARRLLRSVIAAATLATLAACGSSNSDGGAESNSELRDKHRKGVVPRAADAAVLPFRGTDLSGAEFGAALPGTYGVDYIYPTHDEVDYFVGKGMTTFRVSFMWERLQPAAYGDLDATELGRLDDLVRYATSRGASVILNPQNFARYYDGVVGVDVDASVFADFWRRVAEKYRDDTRVIFGLVNEPHDLPTEVWAGDANAAIAAIRAAGATNLVLVPGNSWTGAHAWTKNDYGTSNAVAMLAVTDPGDNYAFEVHQYLDADFSGTYAEGDCMSATLGSESMAAFTGWLRANGKRGFLGELGAPATDTCRAAIEDQLRHVEANADVYLGWTWWSAGPWWGDYALSIEPKDGQDRPMMAVLERHLGR